MSVCFKERPMQGHGFLPWPVAGILLIALVIACSKDESSRTKASRASVVEPAALRFDGLTISALTQSGPHIAEVLQRRAPEFTALTGAKVEIHLVPFSELYRTALDDFERGTARYDVMVLAPQWLVDFAAPGYAEELGQRVAASPSLSWDDIATFYRDFSATYQGRIYMIPLDGDFQMVFYRSDLLETAGLEPPRTWDEYLAIAAALHGKDFDGDGQADHGSCISKRPQDQAYSMFWSMASGFLQSQGTKQGAFFDVETMQPLANNQALARALDIYEATGAFGPEDELELDVAAVRRLFIAGRCALALDWGDIGTLAVAPDSRVVDRVGAVILPGAREVLDRKTGKLVACDKVTCPYAVDGVNHAPYAAFGGWSGMINAAAPEREKDAAFAFLAYLTQPAQANRDVTIGITGFNPYRRSQFLNRQMWLDAGMSERAAGRYLGAIGVSLDNPNMVLDLRVPHNQRYQQVALDSVLARFARGQITRDQAMAELEEDWNRITDELGRARQLAAYRASLGLAR
jgi:multiple sugar transport system substrate-binding protein